MKHSRVLPCVVLTACVYVGFTSDVSAQPIYNPANGHLYELVLQPGVTWNEATNAAAAKPGGWHLATITSAPENAFVQAMLSPGPPFFEATCLTSNLVGRVCGGIWLGGFSSSQGWRWVTGEPFTFGNWGPFEPFGNGDRVRIDEFRDRSQLIAWNDVPAGQLRSTGYLIENDNPPPRLPGDLNGDGHLDLLWHHRADGRLATWLMNGTTLLSGTSLTPSAVGDINWKVVGSGDLNGDGHVDLVWQNIADGRVAAWLMNGLTMQSGALFSIPSVPDLDWRIRSVGDLDGDGRADLFWQHESDGRIAVWLVNGFNVISGSLLNPAQVADTNWKIVGTADFDNDGRRDLLWHHQIDGSLAVWFMNGTSQIAGKPITPASLPDISWQVRGVGDLDGDGHTDLIWQNTGDGRVAVWLMEGLTRISGMLLSPSQVADTNWHIVGPR